MASAQFPGIGHLAGAKPTSSMGAARDVLLGDIERRLASRRLRLERLTGLDSGPPRHFRRPVERPFTAEERGRVTILFGGLTWKHERLLQAVLEGCGHRCQPLPTPDRSACEVGKHYGNNGLCSPAYFTIGNLIAYLQRLEAQGLSRQEIVDRYVFFTAGSCGPCRFGMYEAEYRLALRNAGFDGFRVLLFQQDHGVKADVGQSGLRLTLHLGLGALNAIQFGDAIHDLVYRIRPYEVRPGETDRLVQEAVSVLAAALRDREPFSLPDRMPPWIAGVLGRRPGVARGLEILGKIYDHLYGEATRAALHACRECLDRIEVDRTRVKPIVKITGEFWAQTTESDGNFQMFTFIEREGAQVVVEPIGTWVMYLLHQAKAQLYRRKGLNVPRDQGLWRWLRSRQADEWRFRTTWLKLLLGEVLYADRYRRVSRAFGHLVDPLADQRELARLAHPFYHQLARGGEGHLEVAKNIHTATHARAHMVVSLKPFGCMPSSQSDGVQSSVVARFKDMIFLPVETAGEGELNAHSRVQMALVEARARAKAEFQRALASTGRRLEDIRSYVADHPELRQPFYPVPERPGMIGVAASFVLHVSELMDARPRLVSIGRAIAGRRTAADSGSTDYVHEG